MQCLPAYIPPCKIQQFAQQHPEKVVLATIPNNKNGAEAYLKLFPTISYVVFDTLYMIIFGFATIHTP